MNGFFGYVARQISLYTHVQSYSFLLWKDIEINLDSGQINYKLLSLYGFNYPNYTSGFANMLSSYNQTVS